MASTTIKSKYTLLWTNSNAWATFNSQTLSLDLSKYKFIIVQFRRIANQDQYVDSLCAVDGTETLCFSVPSDANNQYISCRMINVSASAISFRDSYTNGATNNDRMIPHRIYGIN